MGLDVRVDVQHAEPRYFGLGTPVFVLSAAAALLMLGAVLIVTGYLIVGAVAIVLGVCLLPAFLAGVRRWPDSSIARIGVSTADRVRDEAGVAASSVSAWSQAGRDVARLRRQRFRLRRERDARIRELGVVSGARDRRRQAEAIKPAPVAEVEPEREVVAEPRPAATKRQARSR